MGCDFQIVGSQPDPKKQEACLDFMRKYSTLINAKAEKENTAQKSDSDYHFPEGMPIKRRQKLVFRVGNDELPGITRYHGRDIWRPGTLKGEGITFDTQIPWWPGSLSIIFDTGMNGMLCTPDTSSTPEILRLTLGFNDRIPTGQADSYVLAFTVKHHFVPNMVIQADYDVEIYQDLLRESNCWQRICNAGAGALPEMTLESIATVQKLFDELTERQMVERGLTSRNRPE